MSAGTVYLIDDDPSMRRALGRQLRTAGFDVETFDSAQSFLDAPVTDDEVCIVSDVRMPGLTGLDLQSSLAATGRDLPMVFISGHGDVATSVKAMRAGAVHFLPKPFSEREIVSAITEALMRGAHEAAARRDVSEVRKRFATLTPREREVFVLVADGLLNKVIADRLGAAETTVKIHRARVMDKMRARSLADLVRMASRLADSTTPSAAQS